MLIILVSKVRKMKETNIRKSEVFDRYEMQLSIIDIFFMNVMGYHDLVDEVFIKQGLSRVLINTNSQNGTK